VKLAEIFSYPTAVAYWPLSLGRSRFDDLAATLRKPEGGIWIGGDTTENSHSEGAVQAAQRMAAQIAESLRAR
jgi:monoamine oxidase